MQVSGLDCICGRYKKGHQLRESIAPVLEMIGALLHLEGMPDTASRKNAGKSEASH